MTKNAAATAAAATKGQEDKGHYQGLIQNGYRYIYKYIYGSSIMGKVWGKITKHTSPYLYNPMFCHKENHSDHSDAWFLTALLGPHG